MHEPPTGAAGRDRRASYYAGARERCRRYPNADPTSVELILHMFYTGDVMETIIARSFARHGLSASAFNVLMILRHSDAKELPLHHISELLLVTRANVTGLVDCLEQRHLVERHVDARDRRVRIARLTAAGEAMIEAVLPDHYDLLSRLCAGLTEDEQVTLRTLLEKLRVSAEEAQ